MSTERIFMRLVILVLTTAIATSVMAKEERPAGSSCAARVPSIEVSEALTIAINAAAKNSVGETSYVDFVSLECKEKKQYWIIGFRNRTYETGHLLIHVYMDGSTATSVVKDG